jgi:hypothetical protein
MAATLVETKVIPIGQSESLVFGTITGDSSYPTGGYALDPPGDDGLRVAGVLAFGRDDGGERGGLGAVDEEADGVRPNGAAPAQLVEIANTTNLSAQVWEFVAVRPS